MNKIKVLVVDDSALMRKLITNILTKDSQIEVVDTAMNGLFALKKLKTKEIDIILLDIEMPEMNGLEFLKNKRDLGIDIPAIVLSSLGDKPEITMQALDLGAKDFIMKPSGSISLDIERVGTEIISAIKKYGGSKEIKDVEVRKFNEEIDKIITEKIKPEEKQNKNYVIKEIRDKSFKDIESKLKNIELILIGISTGGPAALRDLFSKVSDSKYPILIVQHMPAGFTKEFAKSLDRITNLTVKEAEEGELVRDKHVYIAPGDKHLSFRKYNSKIFIELLDTQPVNGHKPSVDVLFEAAIKNNVKTLSIIMTGMGKDGAYAIKKLHELGHPTIAQSPSDCVVFGMPRVAIELGGVDKILDINDIADFINNL
ncbi:MAG TPA: chemotaxis response regulator protein-glutamate methylesterase [Spirochaetota bacterium]|nr:chemotaxis response regulator protein-glutamate methylesterase [Spirochaetota bacterium]HOM37532.1 chemotaxis response regulator protein-glutamate methylesterase [Spirochaetota bacterium]HPQ49496.1 chemotaxis response regulator protein-glutamate methylesterase [Spirochaetota bacterium]